MNKKLNEAYNSLSEKEQKSYNLIMAKIAKVMNQITNKTQREGVMKKFKDSLEKNNSVSNKVKKLTALAMSVLILASPVTLLTGCDETKTPSDTQVAYVTDTNGEYITDVNGQPIVLQPGEEYIPELSEKLKEHLDAFFADFDFNKAVNGGYVQELNGCYEAFKSWNQESVYNLNSNSLMLEFPKFYEVFLSNLMGPDSKMLLDINIPFIKSDTSIKYLKEGKDTALFIVQTPDGVEWNGVYNGKVYDGGLDVLPDSIPFLVDEERKSLISQLSEDELAMYLDGCIAYLFNADYPLGGKVIGATTGSKTGDNADILLRMTKQYERVPGTDFPDDLLSTKITVKYREGNLEKYIPVVLSTVLDFRYYEENGKSKIERTDCEIFLEVAESNKMLELDSTTYGKLPGYLISNRHCGFLKLNEGTRIVTITEDKEPQNVQLPTTEAEAEK